jgi:DNA invertase Pin-like site-specific DNA recombinase
MKKRAAIYARVSRPYQANENRLSIEAQIDECKTYCKKHGYDICSYFVDKDKYIVQGVRKNPSGERKDRPGYKALLKAAAMVILTLLLHGKKTDFIGAIWLLSH